MLPASLNAQDMFSFVYSKSLKYSFNTDIVFLDRNNAS